MCIFFNSLQNELFSCFPINPITVITCVMSNVMTILYQRQCQNCSVGLVGSEQFFNCGGYIVRFLPYSEDVRDSASSMLTETDEVEHFHQCSISGCLRIQSPFASDDIINLSTVYQGNTEAANGDLGSPSTFWLSGFRPAWLQTVRA